MGGGCGSGTGLWGEVVGGGCVSGTGLWGEVVGVERGCGRRLWKEFEGGRRLQNEAVEGGAPMYSVFREFLLALRCVCRCT